MKMKDRSHPRFSPQWRISRFFLRGRKAKESREESRDVAEEATEPTDFSVTAPSTNIVDFESAKLSEVSSSNQVGVERREEFSEFSLFLDHVSIAENSCNHLEVRLVENRDGVMCKVMDQRVPNHFIYRSSVVESVEGSCEQDIEAGMEIILKPDSPIKESAICTERNGQQLTKSNGKENHETVPESHDNKKFMEKLDDLQSDCRRTESEASSPRVCITTVTVARESPFSRPSVCQEASDHSPASDSLTWISHDQNCELVDERPMKEISFRTLSQIAETSDSDSVDRAESSSLVSSLPKCLRDEIFATFDSESPAPHVPEASVDNGNLSLKEDVHHPLTLQWPEPCSRSPSRVDELLDSLEANQSEELVLRSVGSIDREREHAFTSDDSTISSHGNEDENRVPASCSQTEQARHEELQREGEFMQLFRRVRSGDLQLESAFASVNVLKSKSFDRAANLKNFAMQTLKGCGEAPLPSCQGETAPRNNRSLMDTLTDDENDSRATLTASSMPAASPDTPAPTSPKEPKIALDLRTPKLLIREISTDDESSVMSESLTSDSCSGSSLDADDEDEDDDDDDESSISTRLGKDAPLPVKETKNRFRTRLDREDDEDSSDGYEEFIRGCM